MTETNLMRKDPDAAPNPVGSDHAPTSAGTFSIRRARYFNESEKPPLAAAEQRLLIKQLQAGDTGARRRLIANYMHLVTGHAKRFINRGLAPLDLIREGTHALVHALEKFEPDGGFSFSTYATWCISHNIERALISRNKMTAAFRAATHNGEHNGLAA